MRRKESTSTKKRIRPLCSFHKLKLMAAAILLAALLFVWSPIPAAHAATITVDGTTCTLADAVVAANTDTAVGGCTAGSGTDIIDLQTDVTHTAALPVIESVVILEGNGFTLDGGSNFRGVSVFTNGQLTLNNVTITGGNAATGGGISNRGVLTVNNVTITNNTANNGAAIFNNAGSVTITNSTISGNTASDSGGGITNNQGGDTTLNYSTITNNTAANSGGGIVNNNGSSLTLNRSLIAGNSAAIGVEFRSLNASTVFANNFNLLGEDSNSNAQAFSGFTPCSGGGCTDISATSNGTNPTPMGSIIDTTLADNGGLTFTHAMLPGSPALDQIAIDGLVCDPPNTVDQRNATRANGAGAGGTACDIGAAELSGETPTAIFLQVSSTNNSSSTAGLLAVLLTGLTAVTLIIWRRLKPRHIYQPVE